MKRLALFLPYTLTIYIILNFLSVNPNLLSVYILAQMLIFMMTIATVINLLMWLFFRDLIKTAIGSYLVIFFFFSYSILEQAILTLVNPLIPSSSANVIPFIVILIILGSILYILKTVNSEFKIVCTFLSVFVMALIVQPAFSISKYAWAVSRVEDSPSAENNNKSAETNGQFLPDIYHIVLDGYGQEDVLKDYYDLDNSAFINYLKDRDFIVRDDCHANYIYTPFSVGSMLNMNYIQFVRLDSVSTRQLIIDQLKKNGAGKILTDFGYEYIEVASPVPTRKSSDFMQVYKDKSNVVGYLLIKTPVKHLYKSYSPMNDAEVYDYWRNKLLNYFEEVEAVPGSRSAPVYIYCHLLIPHPPFVFDAEGNAMNPGRPFSINDCNEFVKGVDTQKEYRENYPKQLVFTNHRLEETIDIILSKRKRPTLIIISSDHGPRLLIDQTSFEGSEFNEALPIFLAYKIPEGDSLNLNEVKTPINLYSTILNHYLDTDFPRKPDKFYFTTWPGNVQVYDASNLINSNGMN